MKKEFVIIKLVMLYSHNLLPDDNTEYRIMEKNEAQKIVDMSVHGDQIIANVTPDINKIISSTRSNPSITDTTNLLISQMKGLNDEERLDIIRQITSKYCYYCGGDTFPCYCRRDD